MPFACAYLIVTRAAILTQPINALQPARFVTFAPSWNTTGVAVGEYRVIGCVKYAEKLTSNARKAVISTSIKVYLPLIVR